VKFSELICAIFELGIETTVLAEVLNRVEERPMSSTVPFSPARIHTSPTRMVSRAMIEMPPKRSSSVFWAASASAIPPMPSPASNAETSTPALRSSSSSATKAIRILKSRSASETTATRDCDPERSSRTFAEPAVRSVMRMTSHANPSTKTVFAAIAQ
jgi:hypothetical protein